MPPKPLQRITPTLWILYVSFTFLAFTATTGFQPFSPKGQAVESPYDPHEDLSSVPVTIRLNVTEDGTVKREFVVYIPKRVRRRIRRQQSRVPLVVCFHGMGKTAISALSQDTNWAVLADRLQFMVVFPQAAGSHAETNGQTKWTTPDDFQFVAQVLKRMLTAPMYVDTTKIFVTGVRHGAFFASDVAQQFGSVFSGVYLAQGGLGKLTPQSKEDHKPAVVVSVGERDEQASRSRAAADAYQQAHYKLKKVELPEVGAAYAMQYEADAYRWWIEQHVPVTLNTQELVEILDNPTLYTLPSS